MTNHQRAWLQARRRWRRLLASLVMLGLGAVSPPQAHAAPWPAGEPIAAAERIVAADGLAFAQSGPKRTKAVKPGKIRYKIVHKRVCTYSRQIGAYRCYYRRVKVPVRPAKVKQKRKVKEVVRQTGPSQRRRVRVEDSGAFRGGARPLVGGGGVGPSAFRGSSSAGGGAPFGAQTGGSQSTLRSARRPPGSPPFGAQTGGSQSRPSIRGPQGGSQPPRVFGAQTGGSQRLDRRPGPSAPFVNPRSGGGGFFGGGRGFGGNRGSGAPFGR